MTKVVRVNITLPKELIDKSRILIDEGIYSNFSEMVRAGIKNELEIGMPMITKKKILLKWFKEEKGEELTNLSKEEIIEKIRRTREKLWEEKAEAWIEWI